MDINRIIIVIILQYIQILITLYTRNKYFMSITSQLKNRNIYKSYNLILKEHRTKNILDFLKWLRSKINYSN